MHFHRNFAQAAAALLFVLLMVPGVTVAAGEDDPGMDQELYLEEEGDGGERAADEAGTLQEGDQDLLAPDEEGDALVIEGDEPDGADTDTDGEGMPGDEGAGTGDALVIEEGEPAEETGDDQELLIEEGEETGSETLVVEPGAGAGADIEMAEADEPAEAGRLAITFGPDGAMALSIDEARGEYGRFVDSDSPADNQAYFHTLASFTWKPAGRWDAKVSGRFDSYHQSGDRDWNRSEVDYGESFIRYRDDKLRMTLGTGTVIWGRLDEVSPTDRLSVHDLSRGVLDYVQDRRRAAPLVRFEGFLEDYKLDAVLLPYFRKAKLPGQKGAWYPVDKKRGRILGLKGGSTMKAIVRNANIDTNAPDTYAGYGLRFSGTRGMFDYALTVQRVRQSDPYFRYSPAANTLEAEYPRSWVYGGDLGFEALGGTLRFEAAWISRTPVTRSNGRYETTGSVNWGAGYEFFPGDGDARVTLQVIGSNLVGISNTVDRRNIYTLNSEASIPFLHDRWRFRNRLFLGLGETDVYVNPELAFIAWEPHELYIAAHYLAGDNGTMGGFYKDNSMLTLGWRAEF